MYKSILEKEPTEKSAEQGQLWRTGRARSVLRSLGEGEQTSSISFLTVLLCFLLPPFSFPPGKRLPCSTPGCTRPLKGSRTPGQVTSLSCGQCNGKTQHAPNSYLSLFDSNTHSTKLPRNPKCGQLAWCSSSAGEHIENCMCFAVAPQNNTYPKR